jgi:hypothetical protein
MLASIGVKYSPAPSSDTKFPVVICDTPYPMPEPPAPAETVPNIPAGSFPLGVSGPSKVTTDVDVEKRIPILNPTIIAPYVPLTFLQLQHSAISYPGRTKLRC